MRGAPDFKAWPDAVCGKWKQEFLLWLSYEAGIEILVETGTCEGATPLALHDFFTEIHTIELHRPLFEVACQWIGAFPNVVMYLGDSGTVLPEIIRKFPDQPLLFWLDAHSSGPHTAQDNPLPREVEVIIRMCPDALIVVDDQTSLEEFKHLVPEGWRAEYRTGEIVMHKAGRYAIPPFES